MIKTYKITLKRDNIGGAISQSLAYPLYGELMRRCEHDFAEELHEQTATPIAQHLTIKNSLELEWTVSLFGDEAINALSPVLDSADEYVIDDAHFVLHKTASEAFMTNYGDILSKASEIPFGSRFRVTFGSPTAFKSAGRYVIFPSAALILKSAVSSWNAFCSEYSLDDPDMMNMLLGGVEISGYRLSSAVYPMKGVKIPGFTGTLTLNAKLSPPITDIYKAVMLFCIYSGVGIKTALGMGGTAVEIKQINPLSTVK